VNQKTGGAIQLFGRNNVKERSKAVAAAAAAAAAAAQV